MHSIRISFSGHGVGVYVDGEMMDKVVSIQSFEYADEFAPAFTFDVDGMPELVVDNARICFEYTPRTVREAAEVLRHELLTDVCVYDAFHASILSAIQEMPTVFNECELATRILDRIVGRD